MEPAPELAPVLAESRRAARLVRSSLQFLGRLRNLTPDFRLLRFPPLKDGLHRVSGWAHIAGAVPPLGADFIKPAAPDCALWVLAGALFGALAATSVALWLAVKARKIAADTVAAALVFFLAVALYSFCVIALEKYTGNDPKGVLAKLSTSIAQLQTNLGLVTESLGRVEKKIDAVTEGQKRLERLVIDAAAGGAPAVQAVADIRDLLRPGNSEIDAIPAEKLPGLVKRMLVELQTPAAKAEDFSGTVKRVLTEAQTHAAELNFADAARVLDAALTQTEADDRDRARGRAALLAERGRMARLQLRYRDAAGFYAKAADAAAFDDAAVRKYKLDAAGAFYDLGEEFGDNPALLDAIGIYRSILDMAARDRVPLDWAKTQNNLGVVLDTLGERETGTAHLEEAVAAFRAALKEYTRERVPLDWAMTQMNLGNALGALGERESGTARLDEAVAAYRAALEETTREREPLDWAMTQNNLGVVLDMLGKRESGTARLDEAVATYRAALEEETRDRVPLKWAATQMNLGNALRKLGERAGERDGASGRGGRGLSRGA